MITHMPMPSHTVAAWVGENCTLARQATVRPCARSELSVCQAGRRRYKTRERARCSGPYRFRSTPASRGRGLSHTATSRSGSHGCRSTCLSGAAGRSVQCPGQQGLSARPQIFGGSTYLVPMLAVRSATGRALHRPRAIRAGCRPARGIQRLARAMFHVGVAFRQCADGFDRCHLARACVVPQGSHSAVELVDRVEPLPTRVKAEVPWPCGTASRQVQQ
jgi:hypothetical protein